MDYLLNKAMTLLEKVSNKLSPEELNEFENLKSRLFDKLDSQFDNYNYD